MATAGLVGELTVAKGPGMPQGVDESTESRRLPDWFVTVAEDVLQCCRPEAGIWVDLGCGSGGLGLALWRMSGSTIVLIDPNGSALNAGLEKARDSGLGGRVVAIVARAESIPLPDGCVDLVVSRGSIFFWSDPPQGLREVCRILRPGARAMVGGAEGSGYPEWARREFIRRRREAVVTQGAKSLREFERVRSPERFRQLAEEAGLTGARVVPDPPGCWLVFGEGGCGD